MDGHQLYLSSRYPASMTLWCAYILSVLSWYLYEQHFLCLKTYFVR